jgi:hypothetical protein
MEKKKVKKKPLVVDEGFDLTDSGTTPLPAEQRKGKISDKPKKKSTALSLVDDDLEIKKPKRARDEPSLPILTEDGKKRISKIKATKLNSILGDDAETLQQMLESGDNDSAISILNKRLIQTSIDLIAEVETGIRESNGRYGVHSYNGLVQSIRELMIDLQAAQDRGAMGVTLVETVIRPAMLEIAMILMQEYVSVANEIKLLVEPEIYQKFRTVQKESQARTGAAVQEQYRKIQEATIQFLQR